MKKARTKHIVCTSLMWGWIFQQVRLLCNLFQPLLFLFGQLLSLIHILHGKVPQIRTYEIQEFMDGYIINYLYLLAQFLEQIMQQILCKIRPAFREVMDLSLIHIYRKLIRAYRPTERCTENKSGNEPGNDYFLEIPRHD